MLLKLCFLLLVGLNHYAAENNSLYDESIIGSNVTEFPQENFLTTLVKNIAADPVPNVTEKTDDRSETNSYAPAFPLSDSEDLPKNETKQGPMESLDEGSITDLSMTTQRGNITEENIMEDENQTHIVVTDSNQLDPSKTIPGDSMTTLDEGKTSSLRAIEDADGSSINGSDTIAATSDEIKASSPLRGNNDISKFVTEPVDLQEVKNVSDSTDIHPDGSNSSVTVNDSYVTTLLTPLPSTKTGTVPATDNYTVPFSTVTAEDIVTSITSHVPSTVANVDLTVSQTLMNVTNGTDKNELLTGTPKGVVEPDDSLDIGKENSSTSGEYSNDTQARVSTTFIPENVTSEVVDAKKKGCKFLPEAPFCPARIPVDILHEVKLEFYLLKSNCAQSDIPKIFEAHLRNALGDSSCSSVQRLSFSDGFPYVFRFTDANPNNTVCNRKGLERLKMKMFNGSEICSNFSRAFLPLFKIKSIDVDNKFRCANSRVMSSAMWAIVAVIILSLLPCFIIGMFKILHSKYVKKSIELPSMRTLHHRHPLVLTTDLESIQMKNLMKQENGMESHSNLAFEENENMV